MKWSIAGRRLHCLPGNLNRDEDALFLKPFCCEPVLVISPFTLRNDAPGRGPQRDCAECEFIEREHPSPFRRVPKGCDGVSQYRQDPTFGGVHWWLGP